ncbi:hypothetical protein EB118_06525 [bacterium]|nr:hypothetical protein [bacterium]
MAIAVQLLVKQKDIGVNQHLRTLAQRAARDIDLTYPGDAYPSRLSDLLIKDLVDELNKVKWLGEDPGWDQAIKAVQKELQSRYR